MSGIRIEQLDLKSLGNMFLTKSSLFQFITKDKLVEVLKNLTDEQLDSIGMSRYLIDKIIQSINVEEIDGSIDVVESNGKDYHISPTRGYVDVNGENVLVYQHPLMHNANEVETTYDRQFASTAEKEEWNAKVSQATLDSYLTDLNTYDSLLKRQLTKLQKIVEEHIGQNQPTEFNNNILSINNALQRFCTYFDIQTKVNVYSYEFVHNFGTANIQIQVVDSTTNEVVYPTVYVKDLNTVRIVFSENNFNSSIAGKLFRISMIANYTDSLTLIANSNYSEDTAYNDAISSINKNLYSMTTVNTLNFTSTGNVTVTDRRDVSETGTAAEKEDLVGPRYISVYENTPLGLKDVTSYTDMTFVPSQSGTLTEVIRINPSTLEESRNLYNQGATTYFVAVNTYTPYWKDIRNSVDNIINPNAHSALAVYESDTDDTDTDGAFDSSEYENLFNRMYITNRVIVKLPEGGSAEKAAVTNENIPTNVVGDINEITVTFELNHYFTSEETNDFLHSLVQFYLYNPGPHSFTLILPNVSISKVNDKYLVTITFTPPTDLLVTYEGIPSAWIRMNLIRKSQFFDDSGKALISDIYTSVDNIQLNINYPDAGTVEGDIFDGEYSNVLTYKSIPSVVFNPELFSIQEYNDNNYEVKTVAIDPDPPADPDDPHHSMDYTSTFIPLNPMLDSIMKDRPSKFTIYSDEDFAIKRSVNVTVTDKILANKLDCVSGLINIVEDTDTDTTEYKQIHIGVNEVGEGDYDEDGYDIGYDFYIDVRTIGVYYFKDSKTYYEGLGSSFDNFEFETEELNSNEPIIECEKANKYFIRVRTISRNMQSSVQSVILNVRTYSDVYKELTDSIEIVLDKNDDTGIIYPEKSFNAKFMKLTPGQTINIYDYLQFVYKDELYKISEDPLEKAESFTFIPATGIDSDVLTYDTVHKTITLSNDFSFDSHPDVCSLGVVRLHYIKSGINSVDFNAYALNTHSQGRNPNPNTENSFNDLFNILIYEEGEKIYEELPESTDIVNSTITATLATPFYIYLKSNDNYISDNDDYGVFGENFRITISNDTSDNIGRVDKINNMCYKITPFITGNIDIKLSNGHTYDKILRMYITDPYNTMSQTISVEGNVREVKIVSATDFYNIFDYGNALKVDLTNFNYSSNAKIVVSHNDTTHNVINIDESKIVSIKLDEELEDNMDTIKLVDDSDISGNLTFTFYYVSSNDADTNEGTEG